MFINTTTVGLIGMFLLFTASAKADSLTTGDATAKSSQYIIVGEGSNTTISGNTANSSANTGGGKSSATATSTVSTNEEVESTLEVEVNGQKETKTVTTTGSVTLEKTSDEGKAEAETTVTIKTDTARTLETEKSILVRVADFVVQELQSLIKRFFQF